MGSPWSVCRLRLTGSPAVVDDADWQDRVALAPDRRACVLVRWHAAGNVPGFALVLVDDRRRTVGLGPVFPGACRALQWSEDGPLYETSFDVSGLLPWAAFRRVPAPDLEGALRTSAPLGLPG